MTLLDIITECIDEKMNYSDALLKLKDLNLDPDIQERYEVLLKKISKSEGSNNIWHEQIYSLGAIPNEKYAEILQLCIKYIRSGITSEEICQYIYNDYRISGQLLSYFINEALHIVRLNTLSDDEINHIGQQYIKAVSKVLNIDTKQMESVRVKSDEPEINANDISEVVESEEYTDD